MKITSCGTPKTLIGFAILFAIAILCLGLPELSLALELGAGMVPPSRQMTSLKYTGTIQLQKVHQESIAASVPVYRGQTDGVVLMTTAQWLGLDVGMDSEVTPVSDLYSIQFGATYTHVFEGNKNLSFNAKYGSASDKPFKDSSVTTVDATAIYTFASSPQSSWLLLLNYSNNRPLLNNIPLPGLAYTYMPSKTFRGTFGVPFSAIYWQWDEKWSVNAFTVAPWIVKSTIAYALAGPIQLYSGIDFAQMTFLKFGRSDRKDRLYYDEKKAFVGIKSPLYPALMAELETGYAFDRSVFTAKSYTPWPDNPTDLGASWYGKINLTFTF